MDGATVMGLSRQVVDLQVAEPPLALLTIGGNDLISGLAGDDGAGIETFRTTLDASCASCRSGRS